MTRPEDRGRAVPAFFFAGLRALRRDPVIKAVRAVLDKTPASRAYLVGGAVRNILLKKPLPPDYDFVLSGASAKVFSEALAVELGGTAFLLDKKTSSHRVALEFKGVPCTVDISPVKKREITADLKSRDFTVNAAALEVSRLFAGGAVRLIDPCKAASDADKGLLRMTSGRVFDADPLRCLRAVRLSQQYGLAITEETADLVKRKAGMLKKTSLERVRDELQLIFSNPGTREALNALYGLGIMEVIIPEAAGWEDVRGYKLLSHALKTVGEAEAFLKELSLGEFPRYAEELARHFELDRVDGARTGKMGRTAFFKMAAFLHDIGKPLTMTIVARDGGIRFWGHDHEGGRAARDVMQRLRFSKKTAQETALLVKNHHRIFTLAALKGPSRRAKAHVFNAVGGASGVDLLCLSLIDARATRGEEDEELLSLVLEMLRFYYEDYTAREHKPLMTGEEIMKAFGVPEGPKVGEIIKRISEGIEAGEIKSKRDAVAFIKRRLPARRDAN